MEIKEEVDGNKGRKGVAIKVEMGWQLNKMNVKLHENSGIHGLEFMKKGVEISP